MDRTLCKKFSNHFLYKTLSNHFSKRFILASFLTVVCTNLYSWYTEFSNVKILLSNLKSYSVFLDVDNGHILVWKMIGPSFDHQLIRSFLENELIHIPMLNHLIKFMDLPLWRVLWTRKVYVIAIASFSTFPFMTSLRLFKSIPILSNFTHLLLFSSVQSFPFSNPASILFSFFRYLTRYTGNLQQPSPMWTRAHWYSSSKYFKEKNLQRHLPNVPKPLKAVLECIRGSWAPEIPKWFSWYRRDPSAAGKIWIKHVSVQCGQRPARAWHGADFWGDAPFVGFAPVRKWRQSSCTDFPVSFPGQVRSRHE